MKRQLIALVLMLAVGAHGTFIAFAATSPLMQSDCQTFTESHDFAHKSCCPSGLHTASCCLDACLAIVASTGSPASLVWYGDAAPTRHFQPANFFSRGDSPLIRPPIL
jgi:hypothetical protein